MNEHTMIAEVAALVGDDGTGDLGIIVRQALTDDSNVSAEDIAAVMRDAREEARARDDRE